MSAAATRVRVLDATRACLVERGVAGTTTSEIARRAGVAEGTIFRHFTTKAGLLCATAGDVLADVRGEAARALRADGDRLADADPVEAIDAALAVVWAQYARDDLVAVHELFMAARTDPDLGSLLDELNGPHRDELHALAREVLPSAIAGRSDVAEVVDFVIDGVATIGTARRAGTAATRLAALRAAVLGLLDAPPIDPADGQRIEALAPGPATLSATTLEVPA